ncbi:MULTISPECIES: SDR family oxidoreductase [unclassified Mycobacterium]|uniref:SDR family oxidoreductase n=1 Tax=unclassified Mycobacterium TaxID=2642494 RepID=UPI0029C70FAC|nr:MULTISPECIES: SDR family oxidoreductase [unclassified Mycobacterium]
MASPTTGEEALVVIGVGGMGHAIARRVGAGRVIVLADINQGLLDSTAATLEREGHHVVTHEVDVTSRNSIAALVELATSVGRVTAVAHTAGLSPEQASAASIMAVDLLGVALVIDEFGRIIEPGGAAIVIASMAGHMNPILDPSVELQLASTPADELLDLEACSPARLPTGAHAYPFAKRANQIRVSAAASSWGLRRARINSISPGIISTDMGRQELAGESGRLIQMMTDNAGLRRLGTADDIAAAAEWLLGPASSFVTGTDLLVDGGVTAAIRSGTINLPDLTA